MDKCNRCIEKKFSKIFKQILPCIQFIFITMVKRDGTGVVLSLLPETGKYYSCM